MELLNKQTAKVKNISPVKIIQFGGGNFLRAFTDWMVDIVNEKTDFNASIQIVKNTKTVSKLDLNVQDGLFHTVLAGKMDGQLIQEKRLISCVKGEINPFVDYQRFLALATKPELKLIFSNTTEQGINFDPNVTFADSCPENFAAKLTALLHCRFKNFNNFHTDQIAVLPSELIENNGDTLRKIVLQYTQLWNLEADFEKYIHKNIFFYNTLVDRIVPGFPISESIKIQEDLGFEDQFLVKAEPYYIFVIQGDPIIKKLFPFESAGLNIQLVDDISPYRTLKVRILNGIHTVIVPVALSRGLKTVKQVMEDPFCRNFLENVAFHEIIPSLSHHESEAIAYAKTVMERYENPYMEHLLQSIALNSISKFKVRVLPSIVDFYQKKGFLPSHLITSMAHLLAMYLQPDRLSFELKDDASTLAFFAKLGQEPFSKDTIQLILENETLWGRSLTQIADFEDIIFEKVIEIINKG